MKHPICERNLEKKLFFFLEHEVNKHGVRLETVVMSAKSSNRVKGSVGEGEAGPGIPFL